MRFDELERHNPEAAALIFKHTKEKIEENVCFEVSVLVTHDFPRYAKMLHIETEIDATCVHDLYTDRPFFRLHDANIDPNKIEFYKCREELSFNEHFVHAINNASVARHSMEYVYATDRFDDELITPELRLKYFDEFKITKIIKQFNMGCSLEIKKVVDKLRNEDYIRNSLILDAHGWKPNGRKDWAF